MLEVRWQGSQNGNALKLRDPGKDIARGYRLESEKAQKYRQADDCSHTDRRAHTRPEVVGVGRNHSGRSDNISTVNKLDRVNLKL